VISYLRQVAICGPVLEMIKRTVVQSNDIGITAKVTHISTTESVLRAVSVLPNIDTEEKLRDFAIEHALSNLHLTEIERERLTLAK
jgi:hypothetical protein